MNKKTALETILAHSIISFAMIATIGFPANSVQAAIVTPLFGNSVVGTVFDQNDANAQSI